jgi:hypothetical protein
MTGYGTKLTYREDCGSSASGADLDIGCWKAATVRGAIAAKADMSGKAFLVALIHHLDVRCTNDAIVFVVLLVEVSPKVAAT